MACALETCAIEVTNYNNTKIKVTNYNNYTNRDQLNGIFQVEIDKNESIARFGLMHIIATNICVWLNTLVLEIMNEFSHMSSHGSNETATKSSSSHAETETGM